MYWVVLVSYTVWYWNHILIGTGIKYWVVLISYTEWYWNHILIGTGIKYWVVLITYTEWYWNHILIGTGIMYWVVLISYTECYWYHILNDNLSRYKLPTLCFIVPQYKTYLRAGGNVDILKITKFNRTFSKTFYSEAAK